MNIGILCYPSKGGSGVIAAELGTSLADRGHNVHFISYEKPFRLKEAQNIDFHKVAICNYDLFKYPPYEFALVNKLVEVITTHDLDIIHVHYAIPHVICAYLAKQMVKGFKDIKIVTTLHGTDVTIMGYDRSIRDVLSFGIRESDAITAVSNSLANEASDVFSISKDIHTIYNFTDHKEFSADKFNQGLRDTFAQAEEKIIIHVSNLRSVKRPIDLIEVYKLVKENLPCKLLIVGEESNENDVKRCIHKYGLTDDVFLINGEHEVSSLLAISDLFLLPSEKESFGLAALEAMSVGTPVVATKTGGIPELVVDGETGLLAPVGNIKELATCCIEILTNDSLYRKFSNNARTRAHSKFNKDNIVTEYEQLFYRMIK